MIWRLNFLSIITAFVFCLEAGCLNAQCPVQITDVVFSPQKTRYCRGENITITFVTTGVINDLNWNYNGNSSTTYNSAIDVFHIDGISGSGQLTVMGNLQQCPVDLPPFDIEVVDNPNVGCGPDQILSGNPNYVVLNGNASGGTAPFTYQWTPNSGFVNSTTNASASPNINISVTTNYQLQVTDNNGCQATCNVMVYSAQNIVNNKFYAVLKKEMDAGYYNSVNSGTNLFCFKFDEEYYAPSGASLSYKIFRDDDSAGPSTLMPAILPALIESIGDNRYALNVSTLQAGYYRIYVNNQKNETWQSRIKIN